MGVLPWIPDLDGPVFAAGNEPFAFVVERDCGDVGGVAFERNKLGRTNMRDCGHPSLYDRLTGVEEELPTS